MAVIRQRDQPRNLTGQWQIKVVAALKHLTKKSEWQVYQDDPYKCLKIIVTY